MKHVWVRSILVTAVFPWAQSLFAAEVTSYEELDSRTSACAQKAVTTGVNAWMVARNVDGTLKNRSSESRYSGIYKALQECGVIPPGAIPGPQEISSYFRRPSHFDKSAFLAVKLPDGMSVTYELTGEPGTYAVAKIDRVKFTEQLSAKPNVEKTIYPEPTLDDDRREVATEYQRSCTRAQDADTKRVTMSNSAKQLVVKMSASPVICTSKRIDHIASYLRSLGVGNENTRNAREVNSAR
jgi:hypothetical protein